jgi:Ca-activated chloride channel family protein
VLACARSVAPPPQDPQTPPEPATDLPADIGPALVPEALWARDADTSPIRDIVYTQPGELPRLEYVEGALPLRKTAVKAHLRGPIAEVVVTQRFVNDRPVALEAIYTFPLPENSAVDRLRMVVGERVIEAEIRERAQARREYRAAADAGKTAALLEQERPNVFTQSVANVPPGASIDVEIHYVQTLTYDAGEYEFVFPTVVGPRYVPGDPLARPDGGTGRDHDTTRVPDASRISPPILGRGERTGHDLAIEVVAEAGSPITTWAVPAHEVEALATGERLHLRLTDRDRIPNRDFVLRYRSAGARPVARMFVQPRPDAGGGHFMLVAEPPRLDVDALVGRRELIFVIDVSGSMSGHPLTLAKAAMRAALTDLRPVDTFDVFVFSGQTGRLFAAPRPATSDNVRAALEFVDGLRAGGGTEMAGAVAGALASEVADDRHRYVFFLTDGYTGEEEEIARRARQLVERQRQLGRRARVFGVGIGSSPNSQLIAALSRAGHGVPLAIHVADDVARTVTTFERIIDAPVLTDVAVDWGALAIDATYPGTAPDLFASRPLVVHGRYSGAVPPQLRFTLRGSVGARSVTFPVAVTLAAERGDVLAGLFGRARVDDLDLRRVTASDRVAADQAARAILATGLEYHLVTAYTSLVAVDHGRVHRGPHTTVVQPVEVPAGVSVEHAYGEGDDYAPAEFNKISAELTKKAKELEAQYKKQEQEERKRLLELEKEAMAAEDEDAPLLASSSGSVEEDSEDPLSTRRESRRAEPPAARKPSAHTRIAAITGVTTTVADALRRALAGEQAAIDTCFARATPYRVFRTLRLVLRIAAGQRLIGFKIDTGKPVDATTEACLRQRVESAVTTAATPPGALELELRVRMHR